KITVLGTTDLHANIYNYSYEDGKELENLGMTKVYSVVKEVRKENPNTLLIDNGDTIQGTILSDDLYNNDLSLKNPVIDVMNFMGYDAMVLGNHEFNFGLELIDKLKDEAQFPLLA
ncbi:multifunctional 2',3'-cyclic-nucleotide 2'-phosphodiesterase/5'-nucleotidase/3'-nucleotidase, partial [Vibrio parahaemolyticus]|nr:multifunctional 2',3'-cyclic-nucleotide 2'-phosphodiesterase/5'-nucleotidase/3'-nucleotidase [Vibrio parahaemolyticus]